MYVDVRVCAWVRACVCVRACGRESVHVCMHECLCVQMSTYFVTVALHH